jgi:23S rRNA pseudouridine1911/1915/1917 synthase
MAQPNRSLVLHSDERLLVLAKPAGLSLKTPPSRPGEALERLLVALGPEERALYGWGELHLVHRLDVGTSGVVVLARDQDMHRELVSAFAERRVEKTYLAWVWGHPRPREGRYGAALGPDREDRRRMRVDPQGRPAATRYRVLAAPRHVALVALWPETGRTHQIRVHLAAAGHPVVGDDLYGGPRHHAMRRPPLSEVLGPDHTLLHAWRLALPAPPLRSPLIVTAPWDAAFAAAAQACQVKLVEALDRLFAEP